MDEVAAAIADPVRRQILVMLRDERLAAGEIAERFAITRPAVSRHLRVLRDSGLVRDELVGRQRFYVLESQRLAELAQWLAQFRQISQFQEVSQFQQAPEWERHLDALDTEVYRTRRERRAHGPADQQTGHEADQGKESTA